MGHHYGSPPQASQGWGHSGDWASLTCRLAGGEAMSDEAVAAVGGNRSLIGIDYNLSGH